MVGKQRISMNRPYFMTNKSWYVTIPPKKRIPEHPNIDIVLTRKAEDDEKAVVSYGKFYGLGVGVAYYMDKGEITEDDIYLGEEDCIRLEHIYDTIDE